MRCRRSGSARTSTPIRAASPRPAASSRRAPARRRPPRAARAARARAAAPANGGAARSRSESGENALDLARLVPRGTVSRSRLAPGHLEPPAPASRRAASPRDPSPARVATARQRPAAYRSAVPLDAFLLAFAAAWIHGGEQRLPRPPRRPGGRMALMLIAGVVVYAPLAVPDWRVQSAAIPYIAASAALELGYFALPRGRLPRRRGQPRLPGRARLRAGARARRQRRLPRPPGRRRPGCRGVVTRRVRHRRRGGAFRRSRADARGFLLALVTGVFIAGYTWSTRKGSATPARSPTSSSSSSARRSLRAARLGVSRQRAALRHERPCG